MLQWDMRPNPNPNPISSVTLIYFVIFNFPFLTKVSCWRMYASCVWVCLCLYMADCKYTVWVRQWCWKTFAFHWQAPHLIIFVCLKSHTSSIFFWHRPPKGGCRKPVLGVWVIVSWSRPRRQRQNSGAVWKWRWPSWAPVPNKPTVFVDVKQHFTWHEKNTIQIRLSDVCFITDHVAYASSDKQFDSVETELSFFLFFLTRGGCVSCLRACLGARLLSVPKPFGDRYRVQGRVKVEVAVLGFPSWAFRPNEPYGFRGRKATMKHAQALVSACP